MRPDESDTIMERSCVGRGSGARRAVVLGFLFVSAFAVRLYNIHLPPLNYCPLRQHRSAHIARWLYLRDLDNVPQWRREVARINAEKFCTKEPPIMEHLAAAGYRLAGAERLWIPRAAAALFWVIGGGFLYAAVKRLFRGDAAVLAVAYYLFLPFGIFAGRSFQPEALMIMTFLAAVLAIVWYYERPSRRRLLVAAVISSAAVMVKFVSVFPIVGGFCLAGLFVRPRPRWRELAGYAVFIAIAAGPGLGYYFYVVFFSESMLWVTRITMKPALLASGHFWAGWLRQLGRVVGYLPLALGIAAVFTGRRPTRKGLLAGLWLGFLCFGMFFPLGVFVTGNWDLPVVVVVGVSLGAAGVWVCDRFNRLSRMSRRLVAGIVAGCILAAVVLGATISPAKTRGLDISPTTRSALEAACRWVGFNIHHFKYINEDFAEKVDEARQIGRAVNHSTHTIYLTYEFGTPLTYYGWLSGTNWPQRPSPGVARLAPPEDIGAEQRLRRYMSREPVEYFIVTEIDEFNRQKHLKQLLTANYELVKKNNDYLIFDLRKSIGSGAVEMADEASVK